MISFRSALELQSEIKNDEQQLVDLTQKEGILKTDGEQTLVIQRFPA